MKDGVKRKWVSKKTPSKKYSHRFAAAEEPLEMKKYNHWN